MASCGMVHRLFFVVVYGLSVYGLGVCCLVAPAQCGMVSSALKKIKKIPLQMSFSIKINDSTYIGNLLSGHVSVAASLYVDCTHTIMQQV